MIDLKLTLDDFDGIMMFELIATLGCVDIKAMIAKKMWKFLEMKICPNWSAIDRFFVAFLGLNKMSFD